MSVNSQKHNPTSFKVIINDHKISPNDDIVFNIQDNIQEY